MIALGTASRRDKPSRRRPSPIRVAPVGVPLLTTTHVPITKRKIHNILPIAAGLSTCEVLRRHDHQTVAAVHQAVAGRTATFPYRKCRRPSRAASASRIARRERSPTDATRQSAGRNLGPEIFLPCRSNEKTSRFRPQQYYYAASKWLVPSWAISFRYPADSASRTEKLVRAHGDIFNAKRLYRQSRYPFRSSVAGVDWT